MSKLLKIEQSEKYPDEDASFILGNCFDKKETAEIVHRCNCHDDLVAIMQRYIDYRKGADDNIDAIAKKMEATLAEAKKE